MDLAVETSGTTTCIRVVGELDTTTAPDLDQAIQSFLEAGGVSLWLDLTNTDYVSSIGLRVFLASLKTIKAAGGRMALAGMNEEVQEIMDMAGFSPLFEIFETTEQARSTFAA